MGNVDIQRDEASDAFFEAAANGQLLVRRCENGHFLPVGVRHHYQDRHCTVCLTMNVDWVPASGEATLVSWIVVHTKNQTPHVAGIVELEEGPWLNVLLAVDPSATLHAAQPMTVTFMPPPGNGEWVPAFRPR